MIVFIGTEAINFMLELKAGPECAEQLKISPRSSIPNDNFSIVFTQLFLCLRLRLELVLESQAPKY